MVQMFGHRGFDPYGVVPGPGQPVFPGGAYGSLGDAQGMTRPSAPPVSTTEAMAFLTRITGHLTTAEAALRKGNRAAAQTHADLAANELARLVDRGGSAYIGNLQARIQAIFDALNPPGRTLPSGPSGGSSPQGAAGGGGGRATDPGIMPWSSGGLKPAPGSTKGQGGGSPLEPGVVLNGEDSEPVGKRVPWGWLLAGAIALGAGGYALSKRRRKGG